MSADTLLDDLRALHRSGRRWFCRWEETFAARGWRACMYVAPTMRLDTKLHADVGDAVAELALTWGLMALVEQQARAAGLVS